MFGHIFKYGFKSLMRSKEIVFWSLVFPFALCTFMYLAFSNLFETTEQFQVIPVAVVQEQENPVLQGMLQMVSSEGENQLLSVKETEEANAEKLLSEDEIKGILYVGDSISLKVSGTGMEQTLLKMILNQFVQYGKTMQDVAEVHPDALQNAGMQLAAQVDYFVEKKSSEGNQDNVINYFYAIFAMTCLFAGFAGCDRTIKIQANTSSLGQRRGMAPIHKMKSILADFSVSFLFQYILTCLLLVYMKGVLALDLGDKLPAILLILLVGNAYGIMFGIFIGSLSRFGQGVKIGILVSFSLAMCAISDLMVSGIRDKIEHSIPILNDINPAALICDSFYALNIFDTYGRFWQNIIVLGGWTVLLAVVCYWMIRRNRYASL